MPDVSYFADKLRAVLCARPVLNALTVALAMIVSPEAGSGRIAPCSEVRGFASSGTPFSPAHRQRQLRQQRQYKGRFIVSAAAFRPCIDIHQASADPRPGAYSDSANHLGFARFAPYKLQGAPEHFLNRAGARQADSWVVIEGPSET